MTCYVVLLSLCFGYFSFNLTFLGTLEVFICAMICLTVDHVSVLPHVLHVIASGSPVRRSSTTDKPLIIEATSTRR